MPEQDLVLAQRCLLLSAIRRKVAGVAKADIASAWVDRASAKVRLLAGPPAAKSCQVLSAGVELSWAKAGRRIGASGRRRRAADFDWSGSDQRKATSRSAIRPQTADRQARGRALATRMSCIFRSASSRRSIASPANTSLILEFGICREICVPAEANSSAERCVPLACRAVPYLRPGCIGARAAPGREKPRRRSELETQRPTWRAPRPRSHIAARFPNAGQTTTTFSSRPPVGIYLPPPKRLDADGPRGGLSTTI